VNKSLLSVLILASALLLSGLHYKLKPRPEEKDIRTQAELITSRVLWQGQLAPDFELKTVSGDTFRLSDHVGKEIIVLNFFATWCGPCRGEMPELNRYYDQHKADGLLLVGIDAEEKQDRVEAFLGELKVNFPAAVDSGPIQKAYGVESFPTTVVIGVDGKVQFYETGALANAEVAFDNLIRQNHQLLDSKQTISHDAYLEAVKNLQGLPLRQPPAASTGSEEFKLDERGKRIAARMVCPCGCADKVEKCSCHTSTNVKKALASEDFKSQPDDHIIQGLNKRFCSGAM